MQITKATHQEIVINGVVPIDPIAPLKKSGKPDSQDPLIRICHEHKKFLQKEYDACVAYCVKRPETQGAPAETKIKFYFSNTDKTGRAKIKTKDPNLLEKEGARYCGLMSAFCAESIQKYLDDNNLSD